MLSPTTQLAIEAVAVRLIQAQAADTEDLSDLKSIIERLAEQLEEPDVANALRTASDKLGELIGNPNRPEELLSEAVRLVCQLTSPEAPPPAPTVASLKAPSPALLPTEIDTELVNDFLTEANEHLASAEGALLTLEENPRDSAAVNTVFRAFHTIKGVASLLGLGAVGELSHHAESLLAKIREGRLVCEGANANLCLRATDMLKETVTAVGEALKGQPALLPANYSVLLEDLKAAGLPQPSRAPRHAQGSVAPKRSSKAPREPRVSAIPRVTKASLTPAARRGRSMVPQESAPAPDSARAKKAQGEESSVRVRTDRLDRLVDMVGELVIAHSMLNQNPQGDVPRDPEQHRKVAHAGKIVRELQELSMSLRMVPLRTTFQKLTRIVRDVAKKCNKSIQFVSSGDDTELDRMMVDVIAEPLIHMVRNAADHGIESPEERTAQGKPRQGTIHVAAYRAGSNVVIDLKDDGAGLNPERILQKALAQGLIEPNRVLSESEIFQLIFMPGFSTAQVVTDISGRGVGMDVVRQSIERLKGGIDITSRRGKGTTFSIRLPLTLAITDGMIVRSGKERYIVPTVNISLNFRPEASQVSTVTGRGEMVLLRGELVPLYRLDRLFGIRGAEQDPTKGLVVIVRHGPSVCGLMVDELVGQQQVVAKTLGPEMGQLAAISGGAILGDGRVGLIVDPESLIALAKASEAHPLATVARLPPSRSPNLLI